MATLMELIPQFERLTGKTSNCHENEDFNINVLEEGLELGYSQFNEILLLLGFDRIDRLLFRYIAYGDGKIEDSTSISSLKQLDDGVTRFIILALEFYGNVKFAFNLLANDSNLLARKILVSLPHDIESFRQRHPPLIRIVNIDPEDTYLLGYIVDSEIKAKLKDNPEDQCFLDLQKKRQEIIQVGRNNQIAYLASDHLDVYVATSMRKKYEFISTSNVINEIFESKELLDLRLRWFDPTQAYCDDRIDKGLSEALMLKRASCTLYLAQEVDTLGKDSELASTLAQGKPVLAYIPNGDKEFVENLLETINKSENKDPKIIILEQFKVFAPEIAWDEKEVRGWIDNINEVPIEVLQNKLCSIIKNYYNRRANNLKENHPLGIQVDLNSGVANGVLVVRSIEECIRLIKKIVLNDLDFELREKESTNPDKTMYLVESISQSIFRVKTHNTLLTNAFWNFYQ